MRTALVVLCVVVVVVSLGCDRDGPSLPVRTSPCSSHDHWIWDIVEQPSEDQSAIKDLRAMASIARAHTDDVSALAPTDKEVFLDHARRAAAARDLGARPVSSATDMSTAAERDGWGDDGTVILKNDEYRVILGILKVLGENALEADDHHEADTIANILLRLGSLLSRNGETHYGAAARLAAWQLGLDLKRELAKRQGDEEERSRLDDYELLRVEESKQLRQEIRDWGGY